MTEVAPVRATRVSLLLRLRQEEPDQLAWREFVESYGPLIYRWCQNWKLQESDARDVTRTVLLNLALKMRTFGYDAGRSFRAHLRTLARYAWCDWLENRAVSGAGDSRAVDVLHSVQARDDLVAQLDDQFDREILARAMDEVQSGVEAHTWEAFRLAALEGLSGAETAERLGMQAATMFKARSTVQRMVQEVVARLENGGENPTEP